MTSRSGLVTGLAEHPWPRLSSLRVVACLAAPVGPRSESHSCDARDAVGHEWPIVTAELGKALKLRNCLRRTRWWN